MTKTELLRVLDDIRSGVESGDTLEGNISFFIDHLEPPQACAAWEVEACYRVGNLQGQGGVRLIPVSPRMNEDERG